MRLNEFKLLACYNGSSTAPNILVSKCKQPKKDGE